MYEYKTELLNTRIKFLTNSADLKDIEKLDELINRRASEGWELVTYSYMVNSDNLKSVFSVTFKREK